MPIQVPASHETPSDSLPPSPWLDIPAACAYLGCSRSFLDKDRTTGLHGIPFCRMGRHIRYNVAGLDNFLRRNTVAQGE